MKKSIIITVLCCLSCIMYGQAKTYAVEVLDINGEKMNSKTYTAKEIKSIFGTPSKIEGTTEEMIYKFGDCGVLTANGKIVGFCFNDNTLAAFTNSILGGIKVGDKASEAKAKLRQITSSEIKDFKYTYFYGTTQGFTVGNRDDKISFLTDSSGIITQISYSIE